MSISMVTVPKRRSFTGPSTIRGHQSQQPQNINHTNPHKKNHLCMVHNMIRRARLQYIQINMFEGLFQTLVSIHKISHEKNTTKILYANLRRESGLFCGSPCERKSEKRDLLPPYIATAGGMTTPAGPRKKNRAPQTYFATEVLLGKE